MTLVPPGFFGKAPARGDFITRRLAPSLAAPWDCWLGELTTAVREAAGAAWPEAWLTAPLWQFALGDLLAPAPGAAGVLIASVDRVGRMFPFTIIGPARGVPGDTWFGAVEDLALGSLDDAFDPDALDAALARLGPPADGDPIAAGESFWRCRGSDRVASGAFSLIGLPGRDVARAMVLGDQDGVDKNAGAEDGGDQNAPHSGAK